MACQRCSSNSTPNIRAMHHRWSWCQASQGHLVLPEALSSGRSRNGRSAGCRRGFGVYVGRLPRRILLWSLAVPLFPSGIGTKTASRTASAFGPCMARRVVLGQARRGGSLDIDVSIVSSDCFVGETWSRVWCSRKDWRWRDINAWLSADGRKRELLFGDPVLIDNNTG